MLTIRKNVSVGDNGTLHGDVRFDSVTVTVLLCGARNVRDAWFKAFRRHGFTPLPKTATVADYWQATLSALALTARPVDQRDEEDCVTFLVRGPVESLTFLTEADYFPLEQTRDGNGLARFGQNTARVPRGGRPQDYVSIGTRDVPQSLYAPSPHNRPKVKRLAKPSKGKGTVGDALATVPVVPSVDDASYNPHVGAWMK